MLNRGITVSANNASYDNNKTERLRIDLEKPDLHGNVDGGHIQRVIRETVGSADWEEARQRRIEIGDELKQRLVTKGRALLRPLFYPRSLRFKRCLTMPMTAHSSRAKVQHD